MSTLFESCRYLIPFRTGLLPQIFCDTLVLGSGVAGLRSAIGASAGGDVIVCAKDELDTTNTAWAQGGIAAVMRDDDSIGAHINDTMTAGAGMCDYNAVELVCSQGPERLRELIGWGANFDTDEDSVLSAGREGGHNANRIYHAGGDATGIEIQNTLIETARRRGSIRLFGHCFAIDLLTPSNEPGAPVMGAITWHRKYGLQVIWARTTIVASGGAGQVYRETSNPRVATGDGIAMGYRAGAMVSDMEFVQFHPTTLYIPGAPRSLISEAVRGEGAHLLDDSGNRFMPGIHELAELAPRDVVSRAISRQLAIQGGKHVWLDCRHITNFRARFPSIWSTLESFGINPATDPIPVHPAAHYQIGGIRTDLTTATGVPNLLAIGEASCTGLHGANRLASNSLLEGLVMGAIAGEQAAARSGQPVTPTPIISTITPSTHAQLDLTDVRSSLRSTMWYNAGIARSRTHLADACDMFDLWGRYTLDKVFETPDGWEVQNLLITARLIARAALNRPQSVGTHWIQNSESHSDHSSTAFTADSSLHACWSRHAPDPEYHAHAPEPSAESPVSE